MIQRLNGIMEGTDNIPEQHIGVWNVVCRLHQYYGTSAHLRFSLKEDPGTLVHIELPIAQTEEVDEDEHSDC